jgi:hypothetical protein
MLELLQPDPSLFKPRNPGAIGAARPSGASRILGSCLSIDRQ